MAGPVITVSSGRVPLSGVTITHGSGNMNGCGGGIDNYGTLTVKNSTISGNSAEQCGGAIANTYGSVLMIIDSTISDNHVLGQDAYGGAIANLGVLTIIDSTLVTIM